MVELAMQTFIWFYCRFTVNYLTVLFNDITLNNLDADGLNPDLQRKLLLNLVQQQA